MKTIGQQVAAMQRCWPALKVVLQDRHRAVWIGHVVGLEMRYRVSVDYELIDGSPEARGGFPRVRVLSPVLTLKPDAIDEGPLPHVYFDRDFPLLSVLCLFDPYAGEWTSDDLIADTTIPWTAQWLRCYEAWQVTGRWHCGGRHAGQYNA